MSIGKSDARKLVVPAAIVVDINFATLIAI